MKNQSPPQPSVRLLPGSELRAELWLLGSLVVGGRNTFAAVAGHVSADDFLDTGYGQVFAALVAMNDAGIPTDDFVALQSQFIALGVPVSCRGDAFIFGLIRDQPHPGHAVGYADEVRAAAQKRRFIKLAGEIVELGYDEQASPEQILQIVESALSRIAGRAPVEVVTVGKVAAELVSDLERPQEVQRLSGIMTGLREVDEAMGPWLGGDLIILGGRPGDGKSAMGACIADHNAARGRRTLFISLEMSGPELVGRLLSQMTGVDSRDLRERRVNESDLKKIKSAAVDLQETPLVFRSGAATFSQIRGVARHMRATGGLDFLVVDYLQRIRPEPEDKRLQRHEQVQLLTNGLKDLAMELGIPILCLCQLNRESDKAGAEPRLSNLRESGAIEQDADSVLLIHHPETEAGPAKSGHRLAHLLIAKSRHGEKCRVKLLWYPSETRFGTYAEGF